MLLKRIMQCSTRARHALACDLEIYYDEYIDYVTVIRALFREMLSNVIDFS